MLVDELHVAIDDGLRIEHCTTSSTAARPTASIRIWPSMHLWGQEAHSV